MPHVFHQAGPEHVGIAAGEKPGLVQGRYGVLLVEILAQEQGVDLGGVPAHDDVLVVVRENLGLDKITRTEQVADPRDRLDR